MPRTENGSASSLNTDRLAQSALSGYAITGESPSGLVTATHRSDVKLGDVKLHSSTLRDGQQHAGIVYSEEGKDEVATIEYEVLHPDIMEGGYPGATLTDNNFFELAQDRPYHPILSAFGMTRRKGTHVEKDAGVRHLLDSRAPIITYVGKSHIEQVVKTMNTTPEENLRMIEESVAYARAEGRRVVYDAEHFFDSFDFNREYAMETLYAAARGGAESIALCDTVGRQLPLQVHMKVRAVMEDEELQDLYRAQNGITDPSVKMPLGIHAHNDLELAVANTLIAVDAGVTYVQGTGAGKGERNGNTNLTVAAYILGREDYISLPDEQKRRLTEYDNTIFDRSGLPRNPNQALTGKYASATAAGIHQAAMAIDDSTYVVENPHNLGNNYETFLLNGQSGKSAVRKVMEIRGLPANETVVANVTRLLNLMENQGYRWVGQEASVELLMRRQYADYENTKPFNLKPVLTDEGETSSVTMVFNNDLKPLDIIIDNANVDSIFGTLRHALSTRHTDLLSLRTLNSHIVKENGITRTFISVTNGTDTWQTVGVGKNETEAGLEAAADALEFALYHPRKENHLEA